MVMVMVIVCGVFLGDITLSGCTMCVDSCHAIRRVANVIRCEQVGLLGKELDGSGDEARVDAEE